MKIISLLFTLLLAFQLCTVGIAVSSFDSQMSINTDHSTMECEGPECATAMDSNCAAHCIASSVLTNNQVQFFLSPFFYFLASTAAVVTLLLISKQFSTHNIRFWYPPRYLFETVALRE